MNTLFFIPLWYTYATRLRTVPRAISLFIIYFIPVGILFYFQQPENVASFRFWLSAVLAILGVYTVYEMGYIQNDTETIKLEKHPTMRLSSQQLEFYIIHHTAIYLFRILLICIISTILYILTGLLSIICYLGGLAIIWGVYQIYNRTRGDITMLLYFLLVSLRYIVPLLLFPECLSWNIVILALMIFPIPKTTMFRSECDKNVKTNIYFREYILKWDIKRLSGYRVIIYLFLFIIGYILFIVGYFPISYVYLIVYMFIYRLILYTIIKMGFHPKEYLKG